MNIRVGILGYGNVGKGVEKAVLENKDMTLVAIFTRRDVSQIESNTKVVNIKNILDYKDKIDVLVICHGSAFDMPNDTPLYAKYFNVIDSFDTHSKIYEHFNNVDESSKSNNKVALISCGWDPGLFSINRLMSECIVPNGDTYTFWGPGVSQGHSDALRNIKGVKKAIQYTIPIEENVNKIRNGERIKLTPREKHLRECYVVVEDDSLKERIENEIKTMPNYFDEYNTIVNFITEEEFDKNHNKMPHGGFVVRVSDDEVIEYSLKLNSNPNFTGLILTSYIYAVYRLFNENNYGAKSVFDIPISYLTNKTKDKLLKEYL